MVQTLLLMQQIPAGCTKGRIATAGVSPPDAALSTLIWLLRSCPQLYAHVIAFTWMTLQAPNRKASAPMTPATGRKLGKQPCSTAAARER